MKKSVSVSWSENCPICDEPSAGCLMEMLLSGQTLTDEELSYLQNFDNLKNHAGQQVPLATIAHLECLQLFREGSVQLYGGPRFERVLNWEKFPYVLLNI